MNTLTRTEMHRDHREWESEVGLWRDDLSIWQEELTEMQARLRDALELHSQKLRQHGSGIRLEELQACEHEHVLAVTEKGDAVELPFASVTRHNHEAEQQARNRQSHDELKTRHHVMLAEMKRLLEKLA